MPNKSVLISALLVLLLMARGVSLAKTITVAEPNEPADYSTIQAAIDAAVDSDKIIVSEGTYTENINLLGKAVTLQSTEPLDASTVLKTIIDGGGIGSSITIASGEDANTVIKGFLITGGAQSYGGGMYCLNSNPTIANCTFKGNSAEDGGGGMYCDQCSPTLTSCTFEENSAVTAGGGMYCSDGSPTLNNCTFKGNRVENAIIPGGHVGGGGMYCYDSNSTLINCTFIANSANKMSWGGGGGMYYFDSTITLDNCTRHLLTARLSQIRSQAQKCLPAAACSVATAARHLPTAHSSQTRPPCGERSIMIRLET